MFPQVSTGLTYAEIGPHVLPVTITPPTSENSVWYTSLLHSKYQSKENTLIPAGNANLEDLSFNCVQPFVSKSSSLY